MLDQVIIYQCADCNTGGFITVKDGKIDVSSCDCVRKEENA